MQIRFHLWGAGVAVPKTKFGITALMGASLIIRNGSTEQNFLIYDGFEIGGKSGTLLASSVDTEWLNIDPAEHPWVNTCDTFKDDTFEVVMSGTILNRGYIDLTFEKIDGNNDKITLLKKYNVEAFGGQVTETKVSGKIRSKKNQPCVRSGNADKKSFFTT